MEHTEKFNDTINDVLNEIRKASHDNHYQNNSEMTEITISMGCSHKSDDIKAFNAAFKNATQNTEFETASLKLTQDLNDNSDSITLEQAKLIIPKHPVFGFPSNPKEKILSF
ncbi:MAG: hypothetical protein ACRBDI_05645 [Alphaproteobacteria bacterium]